MSSQHLLASPRSSTDQLRATPGAPRLQSTEDDVAETGLRLGKGAREGGRNYRVLSAVGLVLALLASVILAWANFRERPRTNFILMVSDGFGPASETFAREMQKHLQGLSYRDPFEFPLDSILIGSSRTRSSNSLVTDSAAGATAFSCAQKSYNGAISVSADGRHEPCGTVMEAAKAQNYLTGLVVTSRLTHATPACFYAHVVDRDMESEIATFLVGDGPLGHVVDLALGGGRCFFLPNSTAASCRTDSTDLLSSPSLKSHTVLHSLPDFESAISSFKTLPLPVLGLFHRDHMSYNIDRIRLPEEAAEPSLHAMALTALRTLDAAAADRGSGEGFFLMIEGSRIDMAAHSNDPRNHAEEIFEYQRTVRAVKEWADALPKRHRERTVILSVSDHETGGLALARQNDPLVYPEYNWYPAALVNVTHSAIHLARTIVASLPYSSSTAQRDWLSKEIFFSGLGITDPTEEETTAVLEAHDDVLTLDRLLAGMLSRRAQVGWSTMGHSAVDVNLYMHPFDPHFHGSKENTDIGAYIARHLSLSLAPVTSRLAENLERWFHFTTTSTKPKGGQQRKRSLDVRDIDHYHGGC